MINLSMVGISNEGFNPNLLLPVNDKQFENEDNSIPKRTFPIVVICGSMRFTDLMISEQTKLSESGNIILLPCFTLGNDNKNLEPKMKEMYAQMHFQRIDLADVVYVINKDNYIGKDTQIEIDYSEKKGKIIKYYSKGDFVKHPFGYYYDPFSR